MTVEVEKERELRLVAAAELDEMRCARPRQDPPPTAH